MTIFVIDGPNLNLLGIREPGIYGTETYDELGARIEARALELGIQCRRMQSNHEGDLVDWIQEAYFSHADGIILNPGAYTHTSIALADALKAVSLPTVEVHVSDIDHREEYRRISTVRPLCIGSVTGRGTDGYLEALDRLCRYLEGKP